MWFKAYPNARKACSVVVKCLRRSFDLYYKKIEVVVLCCGLKGFWKHLGGWWWCFIQCCTFLSALFWFNYSFPRGQTCRRLGSVPQGPLGFPRALPISVYFTLFLLRVDYGRRLCRWTVVIPTGLISSPFPFSLLLQMSDIKEIVGPMVKNTIRRTKE